MAAALDLDSGGSIRQARFALGGVAHKPWRVPAAEASLRGKKPGEAAYREAAAIVLRGAKPYHDNAFKVELARRTIVRAFTNLAAV